MKIKWLGSSHWHPRFGTLEGEIDTKKRNIPDDVALNWIGNGYAEEGKSRKAAKSVEILKEEKDNG